MYTDTSLYPRLRLMSDTEMSGLDDRMEPGKSMQAEGATEVTPTTDPEQTTEQMVQAEQQIEALEKQIEAMKQTIEALEKRVPAMDAMEVAETVGGIGAAETEVPLWKLFATRLPPELRIKVHGYVLVVGKLFPGKQHRFLPRDENGDKYQVPDMGWMVALASMDKELMKEGTYLERQNDHGGVVETHLKGEAEEVLYGKNTIIIDGDNYLDFLGEYTHSSCDPWQRNRYIKSLQVRIWDRLDDVYYRDIVARMEPDEPCSPEDRLDFIHDETTDMLVNLVWKEAFDFIDGLPLLQCLKLKLDNAYCPIGCCRFAEKLVKEYLRFESKKNLQEVVLLGAKDNKENETLRDIMRMQVRGPVDGEPDVRVIVKRCGEAESKDW